MFLLEEIARWQHWPNKRVEGIRGLDATALEERAIWTMVLALLGQGTTTTSQVLFSLGIHRDSHRFILS